MRQSRCNGAARTRTGNLGNFQPRTKAAWQGLARRFDDRSIRLPELDEGSATHLYRIAQEATTNAARYAQAKHIAIELRTTPRKLHLSVTDDGIGLSAGLARGTPGLGLKIME